jgi:hypothetical protein
MTCGGGGFVFREEVALAAGDQTDELVLAWPSYSPSQNGPEILSIYLSSADGTAYDWTLFFAPTAAAIAEDVVVIASGEVGVADPDPSVGVDVANSRSECSRLVPFASGAPMPLRVTTSGKTGAGTIRIAWRWGDGM